MVRYELPILTPTWDDSAWTMSVNKLLIRRLLEFVKSFRPDVDLRNLAGMIVAKYKKTMQKRR